MKIKNFMKDKFGFAALFLTLLTGPGLLMTACQPQVNPTSANVATFTPTPGFTPSANATPSVLAAGDVAFIGMDTNLDPGGNDSWAFVCLKSVNAGTTIFFTDEGWDLSTSTTAPATFFLVSSDSVAGWVAPSGGVTAGQIIALNPTGGQSYNAGSWFEAYRPAGTSAIALGNGADQLFAFQSSSVNSSTGAVTSPTFLAGFNIGGAWLVPGVGTAVTTANSYLPTSLTDGTNAGHIATAAKDYWYNYTLTPSYSGGTANDTQANILTSIYTSSNWTQDSAAPIFGGTYSATSATAGYGFPTFQPH